eukprot:GEMP01007534.1.p1 GENE.GEMP01007534.1~~GEMP01007534.1.p1  ORF type:complete len:463 (+),score=50.20 GEMP01007534.1:45-1433(+)
MAVSSRGRIRWVDPYAEIALVWLILEDRKGSRSMGFTSDTEVPRYEKQRWCDGSLKCTCERGNPSQRNNPILYSGNKRRRPNREGRPVLPTVLYVSHIASFLRFEEPVTLLYAIGGRQGDPIGGSTNKLSAVEVFDAWTHRWRSLPSMSINRVGSAACPYGAHGGVLVTGGYSDNPGDPLATTEVFCPMEGCWSTKASMAQKRYGLVLMRAPNDDIYAIGGSSGLDVCSAVERYWVKHDYWTQCADLPEPLAGGRGVEVCGYLLYVGGFVPNGRLSNRIYIYEPEKDSWRVSKVRLRLPRTTFAMGVNAKTDTLILAGGQAPTQVTWMQNRWYDIMPDQFSVSSDVEELSISEILGLEQRVETQESGLARMLPCLPEHRTGCLGTFLEKYGFVVLGGEEEGAHLPNVKSKPRKDWSEAIAYSDGTWKESFPPPIKPRVAFGLVQTSGFPLSCYPPRKTLRLL